MAELNAKSPATKIEARRDAITKLQAELQSEFRLLGTFLNAQKIEPDLDAMKAEHARTGHIIEVAEMTLKGEINHG